MGKTLNKNSSNPKTVAMVEIQGLLRR